ncbi:hypothetical protein GCM10027614_21060 [Micromonospora vulcania]
MNTDPAAIAAARQVLAHLGVTVTDLQSHPATPAVVPTVAEYLPRVIAAAGPGARRTYGTYWERMAAAWPERPVDTVTASDVEALKQAMIASAVSRRNSRNGRHAGEHLVAAARAFFRCAIADGLIDAAASPAHRVAKPRRLPGTRRALTAHELEEINAIARTSGNDVILDALLLRLHTETACAAAAPWPYGWSTSMRPTDSSASPRKDRPSAGSPSPSISPDTCGSTPPLAARSCRPIRSCARATANRSPAAATTTYGNA